MTIMRIHMRSRCPNQLKFSNNEKCIFKCHVKLNEVEDEETRAHKYTYEIK